MKRIQILSILIIFLCSCNTSKQDLLSEVCNNLTELSSVKYIVEHQYISNGKIVFENTDSVYIELQNDNPNQLRYHLNSPESQLIFNGEEMFQSLTAEKIITTNKNGDPENYNNPLIYSLSYLRHVLPKLINNEKVIITKKDTLLNEVDLTYFEFSIDSSYIHPTKYVFIPFDQNSRFSLLVDKRSKLPYKIISPNGSDGTSSQTFKDIQSNVSYDKEIWTGEKLPKDYVRMTEKEYYDNRKNKMKSHLGTYLAGWKLPELLSDSQIEFENIKGNVLLLDFWFKGCAPCISAIPSLNILAAKYSDKDFKIYGIEFNETHDKKTLENYIEVNQIKYPNLYMGKKMALNYGITGAPTFMIVDKHGEIIHIESGFSDEHIKEIEEVIMKNI